MSSTPETRPSLLIRVRDPADQAAWQEFVEIYRPVILRLARQKGMQAADAEDVAQEVLTAVAKAVEQREHDPKRAKFRTWLHRVANNAILDALTRGKPDRGSGDSALQAVLNQREVAQPGPIRTSCGWSTGGRCFAGPPGMFARSSARTPGTLSG